MLQNQCGSHHPLCLETLLGDWVSEQMVSQTCFVFHYDRRGCNLRRTQFLQTQPGQPLALLYARLQRITLDDAGAEATGEGVTGAVGVVDELLLDDGDGVLLDLGFFVLALDGHDGGVGALGDDDDPGSLGVDLGCLGHEFGALGHADPTLPLRLGPGLGLVLVAEDVVGVGHEFGELVLEELGDEAGRQGEHEGLVVGGGVLGHGHGGRRAHGQVVAADVVDVGGLDHRPDARLLEVLEFVVVGRGEVGAHGPVVAGDDDSAFPGGRRGVDHVLDVKTLRCGLSASKGPRPVRGYVRGQTGHRRVFNSYLVRRTFHGESLRTRRRRRNQCKRPSWVGACTGHHGRCSGPPLPG